MLCTRDLYLSKIMCETGKAVKVALSSKKTVARMQDRLSSDTYQLCPRTSSAEYPVICKNLDRPRQLLSHRIVEEIPGSDHRNIVVSHRSTHAAVKRAYTNTVVKYCLRSSEA